MCFIATSKLYDWLGFKIDMFVGILNSKTCILKQTGHFLHAVYPPGEKTYQTGFVIFSSTHVMLCDHKEFFIATSKLYGWRRIQIYMFVDI